MCPVFAAADRIGRRARALNRLHLDANKFGSQYQPSHAAIFTFKERAGQVSQQLLVDREVQLLIDLPGAAVFLDSDHRRALQIADLFQIQIIAAWFVPHDLHIAIDLFQQTDLVPIFQP